MATVRVAGKEEKTTPDGTEEFLAGITAGDKNITTKTMLSDRILSKSVAGSTDVTLTLTEALYGQMVFTGVLTGNISVTVPDSMPKRWAVYNNTTGSYTLTFKPVSGAGVVLTQGIRDKVVSDGTNAVFDGISQSANRMVGIQKWAKGADVASATALTVGTDGNYFDVTGTAAITSITTVAIGTVIKLHFDGALTLTHHSTDLVLPGGTSITTAANDEAEFVEYAAGDWRCTNYTSAAGEADLGSNTFAGGQNFSRATVASHATTADIWGAAGNQIDWTGTATTTAFPNAPQGGAERVLICAGACSFTAGANMLIDGVASGATVTCAVNDQVIVRAVSTTQFKLSRIKYDGTAQVGGAWVHLSTVIASSSATVDIETTFDSTYDFYVIKVAGIKTQTDAQNLLLLMKIGGSYVASGYYGHISIVDGTINNYDGYGTNSGPSVVIAPALGNASGEGASFTLNIYAPQDTTLAKRIDLTGSFVNSSGVFKNASGFAANSGTSALTGIRFQSASGNITSGTFRLYGIKNS